MRKPSMNAGSRFKRTLLLTLLCSGIATPTAFAGGAPTASGALVPIAGTACGRGTSANNCFAASYNPAAVAVDSTGRYAYVLDEGAEAVSAYTIGSGGRLIPIATGKCLSGQHSPKNCFGTALDPWSIAIDPKGPYVYIANSDMGKVSAHRIGAGGVLTPIHGNKCRARWVSNCVAAGYEAMSVAVDPKGRYVYVDNRQGSNISGYTIAAGGTLKPIPAEACQRKGDRHRTPDPENCFRTGSEPRAVAVDPMGRYVYVADESNAVSAYAIGKGGGLMPIAGSACQRAWADRAEPAVSSCFPAGRRPWSIAIDPKGRYVYVINLGGNDISAYTIGKGGALAPVRGGACNGVKGAGNCFPAGASPQAVAVGPQGRYVYVANRGGNDVSAYAIGAGGALAPIAGSACNGVKGLDNCFAAGRTPFAVTVDPSGRYVYVTNWDGKNLSAYRIVGHK